MGRAGSVAHPHTAVDDELGPGDKARVVGEQERHCCSDFAGRAESSERDLGEELFREASDLVGAEAGRVEEAGVDRPGTDGVHADGAWCEFVGEDVRR